MFQCFYKEKKLYFVIRRFYSFYNLQFHSTLFFEATSRNPGGIYLFKINNANTRARCEICSKLTIKTEQSHWPHSGVFVFNFGYISHLALVFLLLTLSR